MSREEYLKKPAEWIKLYTDRKGNLQLDQLIELVQDEAYTKGWVAAVERCSLLVKKRTEELVEWIDEEKKSVPGA